MVFFFHCGRRTKKFLSLVDPRQALIVGLNRGIRTPGGAIVDRSHVEFVGQMSLPLDDATRTDYELVATIEVSIFL